MIHTKQKLQDMVFFLSKSKRLDLLIAEEVKSTILTCVGKDHKNIILDLSGIHFIDSTALSMLSELDGILSGKGCFFHLSNASAEVQELIDLGKYHMKLMFHEPDHKKPPLAA
jgi:anti-anti-sigma factor